MPLNFFEKHNVLKSFQKFEIHCKWSKRESVYTQLNKLTYSIADSMFKEGNVKYKTVKYFKFVSLLISLRNRK